MQIKMQSKEENMIRNSAIEGHSDGHKMSKVRYKITKRKIRNV
jgi:hypothetical protein